MRTSSFQKCLNLNMGRRYNIPKNYKPVWDIKVFDEQEEKECEHTVNVA